MRLYHIHPQEFLIQNKTAKFVGIGLGSGENLFIVPVHITETVGEDTWGMMHTVRGFPKIQSGVDEGPGWIAFLDSFHKGGKAIGAIFARQGDDVELVSARMAEDDQTRWEQALVVVRGEAVFFIQRTSPPSLRLEFKETEVIETKLVTDVSGLIRITDQDIPKWKNKNAEKAEVETSPAEDH